MIRHSDDSKTVELSRKIEARDQELLEATKVIAQLRSAKREVVDSPFEAPLFEMEVPEDLSNKRPSKAQVDERKVIMKKMNQKRETVKDMLDKKAVVETDQQTVKYNHSEEDEKSDSDDEGDDEEEIKRNRQKSELEKTLNGGSLE
jgi:hypothetical protein